MSYYLKVSRYRGSCGKLHLVQRGGTLALCGSFCPWDVRERDVEKQVCLSCIMVDAGLRRAGYGVKVSN